MGISFDCLRQFFALADIASPYLKAPPANTRPTIKNHAAVRALVSMPMLAEPVFVNADAVGHGRAHLFVSSSKQST